MIAPPGRSSWRAASLAATALEQGRPVIAVTDHDDTDISAHATAVLPVQGRAREEFSPILYHVFAGYVASRLAQTLGRLPFQANRPDHIA